MMGNTKGAGTNAEMLVGKVIPERLRVPEINFLSLFLRLVKCLYFLSIFTGGDINKHVA